MENVPIYHFDPGQVMLRLISIPTSKIPISFPSSFLNNLNKDPSIYNYKCVDLNNILALARKWNIKVIFFDGIEPLNALNIIEYINIIKKEGFHVGIRTQGLIPFDLISKLANQSFLDFLLVDISPEGYKDIKTKIKIYNFLSKATYINSLHIEVVVHMAKERPLLIVPIINNIKNKDIPLHIKVYEPIGLGYMPFLKLTTNTLNYVYVHAGGFSLFDTQCPRCKNYIAIRERGILVKLILNENRTCPKCGTRIPFRGDISKMTSKRVARETRGEAIWYHLEALPLRTIIC